MNLFDFVRHIEAILPPQTAMKGDRIGLQLQSGRTDVTTVLVTMEVTDAIVQEAIEQNIDCILSFHPLIFAPLTALVEQERVGRLCSRLIQHSIALVVAHTNFDAFPEGTSTLFARHLGWTIEGVLVPDVLQQGFGMGVIARTGTPLSETAFVAHVHKYSTSPIRFNRGNGMPIERVAIVGGSGASFIEQALAAGVEAFITADLKYHDFHRVQGQILLLDPGHYEMEQFVPRGLAKIIAKISATIAANTAKRLVIKHSQNVPNPICYYPNTEFYREAQQQVLTLS